jgi:hypothetical protein
MTVAEEDEEDVETDMGSPAPAAAIIAGDLGGRGGGTREARLDEPVDDGGEEQSHGAGVRRFTPSPSVPPPDDEMLGFTHGSVTLTIRSWKEGKIRVILNQT